MNRKIYLTNLAVDTTDDRFHKLDVSEKISLIEKELVHINNELQKAEYQETIDDPIRAIFVAPEYFFARSAPEYYPVRFGVPIPSDRVGRHYEYKEYIRIREALTILSQKYRKILIIPGTIAWKDKISEKI